jgi:repressor LexA
VSRRRVYADVRDFLQGKACPANVYEVCDRAGLEVSYLLKVLQSNGQPRSGTGRRHAAWQRQVDNHPALYIEPHDLPGEVALPSRIGRTVLVAVYGWIKAGPLNLVSRAFEGAFLLDKRLVGEGALFMLKVVGDSMIDAGIADGNWVVVRQQKHANNDDIVAAMVGEEVTVKTLHREPGVLELMPQNPQYGPIPVAESELDILGTVVGVVRQALQQMKAGEKWALAVSLTRRS